MRIGKTRFRRELVNPQASGTAGRHWRIGIRAIGVVAGAERESGDVARRVVRAGKGTESSNGRIAGIRKTVAEDNELIHGCDRDGKSRTYRYQERQTYCQSEIKAHTEKIANERFSYTEIAYNSSKPLRRSLCQQQF